MKSRAATVEAVIVCVEVVGPGAWALKIQKEPEAF